MSLTSTNIRVAFSPPTLYPGARASTTRAFTNNTFFQWDPTTPVANSQWCGLFCDPITTIPENHLAAVVINNKAEYVWAFNSNSGDIINTVQMAEGPLSVGNVMQTIYEATQQIITDDQFRDLAGTDGMPTGGDGGLGGLGGLGVLNGGLGLTDGGSGITPSTESTGGDEGGGTRTIADAIRAGAASALSYPSLTSLVQEAPNLIRINCW